MTDPRDDADFEAYMDGDSPVSRRYAQLASEEPPPELDAEILEAARRAVHPNVLPLRKSPRRWMVPVTVAATIVLSFSLVMSIVFDPSVTMSDGDMQFPGVIEEKEVAQIETREQAADMRTQETEALPRPAASAPRSEAVEMPVAGVLALDSSDPDAAGPARNSLDLLASLRALAPRADDEQAEAVEESRFRRENGAFVALQRKSLPEETDAADDAIVGDADGELAQILALFESDEEQAALEALQSFSRSWPDHPASQIFIEWAGDAE